MKLSAAMQRSQGVIDRFLDGLWLEDGLARNSLAAYRRDLTLFAAWLADAEGRDLCESRALDVQAVGARAAPGGYPPALRLGR